MSQTNTGADKTVCKDIALQREREERSNNTVTYSVMLFDRSSWSQKHSSTNTTYIHLAREYWVSSQSYETHHLANMWKQHKQKDETFITMKPTQLKILPLPRSIKAHTACVHTECTQKVTYVIKLPATYVSLPHLSISVTQFGLLILCSSRVPSDKYSSRACCPDRKYSLVIPFQAL